MTSIPLRIYINEQPLTVPAGSTVAAALMAFDPALTAKVGAGTASVTDGRGLPLGLDSALSGGAILRIIGGRAEPDAIP